ncbi:hypothetical protein AX16_007829 [Volvariella volvacea WC 439]|nr:hypothetical protein AX16_007829 [Volvariella volvacea WC 439]
MLSCTLIALALQAGLALATPLAGGAPPTVRLDSATITGVSSGSISQFLGIPYALPPTGNRRFRLPQRIPPYTNSFSATTFGASCPQRTSQLPIPDGFAPEALAFMANITGPPPPDDEDCLNLNVIVPANVPAGTKLPVLAWIFGGIELLVVYSGFETGSTSSFNGPAVVERSIELGMPVVYVGMNYRLSAFGFLGGKEVKKAGVANLGLQDQREALRWIQRYIVAFGGDPTKVTIWGESAGSFSVALHMVANNGNTEGLFRAGFMQSGFQIPTGDIANGQRYYDALVADAGCSGAADTLQCLRSVPYDKLLAAVNKSPSLFSYQSLNLAWMPRADGVFLTDNPQRLLKHGKIANIPFVAGTCDDEGTIFALSTTNITTDSQFRSYVKYTFLPGISDRQVNRLAHLYPDSIPAGSPFDTGNLNALTPQYKRLAAFFGDIVFEAPRRLFVKKRADRQPAWVFLSKRFKTLPHLGAVHAHDILNVFGGGELQDYLIRFAVNLDPNGPGSPTWPRYTNASPRIMTFLDGPSPYTISKDNYRKEALEFLSDLTLEVPF